MRGGGPGRRRCRWYPEGGFELGRKGLRVRRAGRMIGRRLWELWRRDLEAARRWAVRRCQRLVVLALGRKHQVGVVVKVDRRRWIGSQMEPLLV